MIPFNPGIFLYLYIAEMLVWMTPLFILTTFIIVVRIFYVAKKEELSFFKSFFKRKIFAGFSIIIFILTGILLVVSYEVIHLQFALSTLNDDEWRKEYEQKTRYQKMRQNFVLEHDHLYGAFVFPKGSLINRYDPSDNGDETYPLILSGLRTAVFPKPIEIAGILGVKIDARGYVELAEDQMVGPQHYYSHKTGQWTEDRTFPLMACAKASVALYEKPFAPSSNWDEEEWWREKDGLDAHFKPSEWQFRYCNNNHTIEILPAYGTKEAIAIEVAEEKAEEERRKKPETILRNGVLMDAEEVVFSISYLLEAQQQYLFSGNKDLQTEDYLKIYELFEKAADNGEEEAYYYLGIMNYAGEGVPQDREKALYWLQKSVDAGNEEAIARIGSIYLHDEEVQDDTRAREIFQKVAESERNETAEYYLGQIYAEGLGVEQNYQKALEWFKKAADPFHAIGMTGYHPLALRAMLNVGKFYEEGLVGEKDYAAAEPWYDKACHLELEEACEHLKDVMQ